jgi:hypothetical protein
MSLLLLTPSLLHSKKCLLYLGTVLPLTYRSFMSIAASSMSLLLCCHRGCFLVSLLHLFSTNSAFTFMYLIAYCSRDFFQLHRDHSIPKSWQVGLLFVRQQAPGAPLANLAAPTAGWCYTSALREASYPAPSYPQPSNVLHHMGGHRKPNACS